MREKLRMILGLSRWETGAFGDGEDMGGGIRAIGLSSDKNIVRCAEDPPAWTKKTTAVIK